MEQYTKIAFDWLVKPFVSVVIGRTILAVCHTFGWFPDQLLARLIVSTPSAFETEVVVWLLSAIVGGALWTALHFALYRKTAADGPANVPRHERPVNGRQFRTQSDAPELPDFPLHELFSHIDPDVLNDDPNNNRWEKVGQEIRDALALRRLKCWGRPLLESWRSTLEDSQWPPREEIPAEYWRDGTFTYTFFDATRPFAQPDTYPGRGSNFPPYFDVCVNREKAKEVWPRQPTQAPDMTIGQAVNYLLKESIWGFKPGNQWDAHPALDVGARSGAIKVWGEQSIDSAESLQRQLSNWSKGELLDLRFGGVEVEIPVADWAHMEITYPTIMYDDHPSTYRPHMATPKDDQCVRCYRFLRVNRSQIEKQWPRRR